MIHDASFIVSRAATKRSVKKIADFGTRATIEVALFSSEMVSE